MPFIPADKMRKLREAAKNGDERAKKIIDAHFHNKDYKADLESYFASASEPAQMSATNTGKMPANVSTGNAKLDEFLRGNGIKEGDPDYADALEDYYREFPNERPTEEQKPGLESQHIAEHVPENEDVQEEVEMTRTIAQHLIETISRCDETLLAIAQNDDIDDTTRKGAMTILQELKQNLLDSADKVKKIKQSLCKNKENNLE